MKKSFSNITAWIVIVVMVFIVGLFYFESIKTERTIPYSKFEQYWINDEVQSIKISEGSLAIEGTLKNREQFVTIVPQNRLNLLFDKYPKNGEVIETSEISAIKKETSQNLQLFEVDDANHAKNIVKEIVVIDKNRFKINLPKEEVPNLIKELVQNNVKIYEAKQEEKTLEDAFFEKTGGNVIE